MTISSYILDGSSITSNKPIMVFTRTDLEYSVEANLILNIGPERINTPLHQNWIHIYKGHSMAQHKNCFQFYPWKIIPTGTDLQKNVRKCSTPNETNHIKKFYAMNKNQQIIFMQINKKTFKTPTTI